jgi:hypothetical protein
MKLATDLTLPVYADDYPIADPVSGTYTFRHKGEEYLTEGFYGLELRNPSKLVYSREYQTDQVYFGGKPTEDYWSDYEPTEEEGFASVQQEQWRTYKETGIVFPIWVRY